MPPQTSFEQHVMPNRGEVNRMRLGVTFNGALVPPMKFSVGKLHEYQGKRSTANSCIQKGQQPVLFVFQFNTVTVYVRLQSLCLWYSIISRYLCIVTSTSRY
jgi:hypothetical protein